MMNRKFYMPLLICCVLTGASRSVYAQFTMSAEVRPRAEFRDGFKRPLAKGTDAAFFVEQRTRLNTGFTSDKMELYISLQDVRNWGAASQIYKADPSLHNVYEAWASYHFNAKHNLAVGRMELDYDNARILGNLDWAAQGRSHDLIRYTYTGARSVLQAGVAFNQDAATAEPVKLSGTYYGVLNNYKTMQFLRYHRDWDQAGISLLFLNNGAAGTRTTNGATVADSTVYFSQTVGIYGTKKIGIASLEYDAYYQGGKNPAGRTLRAYMAGASISFLKSKPNNFAVGADFLTGDQGSTTERDENFNPLYGTHHKFYGFMDYFYVGSGHQNKGLIDGFARAKLKTGARSSLVVHVHEFFTQSKITGGDNSTLSPRLGTETDLVYTLHVAPGVAFNAGYSHMFFTESLNVIKGVGDPKNSAAWAWAMISFKPVLFTNKESSQ